MQKYVSKTTLSARPAEQLYETLSSLEHLALLPPNEVISQVEADRDTCHFVLKDQFRIGVQIVERAPHSTVKLAHCDDSPFEFNAWVQLKDLGARGTAIRITLHAKVPLLLRPMVGKKLQEGVNLFAERIASM